MKRRGGDELKGARFKARRNGNYDDDGSDSEDDGLLSHMESWIQSVTPGQVHLARSMSNTEFVSIIRSFPDGYEELFTKAYTRSGCRMLEGDEDAQLKLCAFYFTSQYGDDYADVWAKPTEPMVQTSNDNRGQKALFDSILGQLSEVMQANKANTAPNKGSSKTNTPNPSNRPSNYQRSSSGKFSKTATVGGGKKSQSRPPTASVEGGKTKLIKVPVKANISAQASWSEYCATLPGAELTLTKQQLSRAKGLRLGDAYVTGQRVDVSTPTGIRRVLIMFFKLPAATAVAVNSDSSGNMKLNLEDDSVREAMQNSLKSSACGQTEKLGLALDYLASKVKVGDGAVTFEVGHMDGAVVLRFRHSTHGGGAHTGATSLSGRVGSQSSLSASVSSFSSSSAGESTTVKVKSKPPPIAARSLSELEDGESSGSSSDDDDLLNLTPFTRAKSDLEESLGESGESSDVEILDVTPKAKSSPSGDEQEGGKRTSVVPKAEDPSSDDEDDQDYFTENAADGQLRDLSSRALSKRVTDLEGKVGDRISGVQEVAQAQIDVVQGQLDEMRRQINDIEPLKNHIKEVGLNCENAGYKSAKNQLLLAEFMSSVDTMETKFLGQLGSLEQRYNELEVAVGELRSVLATAPPVTTTPVGTATPAAAVAAGPEQVFSPLVGERLSTQLSQELNLAQAKGLYKAVVAGSGDSDSSSKLFLCQAIATALTSGPGRPAETVLQEVRNYSSATYDFIIDHYDPQVRA